MPRVNFEDSVESDQRFWLLAAELNSKDIIQGADQARGMLIRWWRLAQNFYAKDARLVPKDVFKNGGFQILEKVGFAVVQKKGVYAKGAKKHFAWYAQRVDAARKSATQRKGKSVRRARKSVERKQDSGEPLTLTPTPTLTQSSSKTIKSPNGDSSKTDVCDPPTKFSLLEIWNDNCGTLPKVRALNKSRKAKMRQRIGELPSKGDWVEIVSKIAGSEFCNGSGNRAWQATFDWLIANDANWVKVQEGHYDNRSKKLPDYSNLELV